MELWTGALSLVENATDLIWRVLVFFWRNLFLNSLKNLNTVTLTVWPINSGEIDLFYSSHTSHHPSQTPCLPWISYATQKLMLDFCKMVEKQSEAFHTFLWQHFFPSLKTEFLLHIVLSKVSLTSRLHFWNSPSSDNQALVRCIPNPAVAVHLNVKS